MKKSIFIFVGITVLSAAAMDNKEKNKTNAQLETVVTFALKDEHIFVKKRDRLLGVCGGNPYDNCANIERLNRVMQEIMVTHSIKYNTK